MKRSGYIFVCRLFAIYVLYGALSFVSSSVWKLYADLRVVMVDDDESIARFLFSYPADWLLILVPVIPIFALAVWLWCSPTALIPTVDPSPGSSQPWLLLGVRLLGLYILVWALPSLVSGLVMLPDALNDDRQPSWMTRNLTKHLIGMAIQSATGVFLLVKSKWLVAKFDD